MKNSKIIFFIAFLLFIFFGCTDDVEKNIAGQEPLEAVITITCNDSIEYTITVNESNYLYLNNAVIVDSFENHVGYTFHAEGDNPEENRTIMMLKPGFCLNYYSSDLKINSGVYLTMVFHIWPPPPPDSSCYSFYFVLLDTPDPPAPAPIHIFVEPQSGEDFIIDINPDVNILNLDSAVDTSIFLPLQSEIEFDPEGNFPFGTQFLIIRHNIYQNGSERVDCIILHLKSDSTYSNMGISTGSVISEITKAGVLQFPE